VPDFFMPEIRQKMHDFRQFINGNICTVFQILFTYSYGHRRA